MPHLRANTSFSTLGQVFLVLALACTAAVAAPIATARPAGAAIDTWYATVDRVNDGDTFEVLWNRGDAQPAGLTNRIRLIGVDTNETTTNQCFAAAAAAFVEARIPAGTVVRLRARDSGSNASGRPLRHVFYGPGFERNLSLELIEAGLGLAASYDDEPDYRSDYFEAVEGAVNAGAGMFGEGACGGSPSTWPQLDVHVNWDAPGADNNNPNGEYIQIENRGSQSLVMNGWTFRSSARNSGNTKSIPNGTTVPAGGRLKVHMGSGTNRAGHTYIGESKGWFDNTADVLYLRDQHLNVRAFQIWPCTVTCGTSGTLKVEAVSFDAPGDDNANPNGEWVRLRNIGPATIDLTDWKLQDNGTDYHFRSGLTIARGATVTVHVGKGSNSLSTLYWGNNAGILANSGDALWVFNDRHVPIDCYAYGSAECENEPVRGAVQVTAHYDAKGKDARHPNREWVALENTSDKRVNISGHKVRVARKVYTFPSGTRIEPGKRLRLRVGSGKNTASNHYWRQPEGIMANSGGSVQLLDRRNQVLVEHRWKCSDCGPDGPFVITRVKFNAAGKDSKNLNGEWVRIRNTGDERANLRDYMVKVGGKQHVFVKSKWVKPGKSVTLHMGRGRDKGSDLYWGSKREILKNKGRKVALYTPHRELVDCSAYRRASCPAGSVGLATAVKLVVNYDAEGDDAVNLNGEYVDVRNTTNASISLDGYELYSDGESYRFDAGDVIPAGKRIRVRSGKGTDSGLVRYAHTDMAPFSNTADEVELRTTSGRVVSVVTW